MLTPWIPARLKWYSPTRGYGFVVVPIGGTIKDAFLHANLLEAKGFIKVPKTEDLLVKCETIRGKYKVIDIQLDKGQS